MVATLFASCSCYGGNDGLPGNAHNWSVAYLWLHLWPCFLTPNADDIVFSQKSSEQNERPKLIGILGGAGTYAVLGARLFAPGDAARQVGWVVHSGYDFPLHARQEIDLWGMSTMYIDTPNRRTTRALNTYSDELRGFEFLTPEIRVDHTMLDEQLLNAKTFHIIGKPQRCINVIEGIVARRAGNSASKAQARPNVVWEPMENSCSPGNLPLFQDAMKLVDTFSPNEDEFAKLFGIELSNGEELPLAFMEEISRTLLVNCGFNALVIRLGARGALVVQRQGLASRCRLLPAYHQPSKVDQIPSKIVDVTGGGNTFLGGYCMALSGERKIDCCTTYESAAAIGSVAASFAIEQIGMPELSKSNAGTELWNGVRVQERLHDYAERIKSIS